MAKRLGRGLDALIPSLEVEVNDQIIEVECADIRPNPFQPRKEFDEKALDELAESIKERRREPSRRAAADDGNAAEWLTHRTSPRTLSRP